MRSQAQADWTVRLDRREFYLSEEEYQTLKKAAMSGKTMVWFGDFVISIPHISYIEKIGRWTPINKPAQLPEKPVKDLHERIISTKQKLFGPHKEDHGKKS